MGLRLFRSSGETCGLRNRTSGGGVGVSGGGQPVLGEPNPSKFNLVREKCLGGYLVAEIKYEGCKNYEGKKVLVFKGVPTLSGISKVDPHFLEKGLSPIARFEPTKRGWGMAQLLVVSLNKEE